ncbi:MAG TPA: hypothetical protein VJ747_08460 [Stellaceae bacterium]|nr:hypothetical protein [Stellaceae bacterium]
MKLPTIALILVLPFALVACNTARGIKEDATAAGHAVKEKVSGNKSDSNAQSAPAAGSSTAPTSSEPAPAPQSQ